LSMMEAHRRNVARVINSVFSAFERLPADVSCQKMNLPCVAEFNGIGHRHGNAVRFFAGGATGAPYTQRAWIFPELAHLQLWQDFFLQSFKYRGITEKGRFLREQPLQQRIVLNVGVLDQAQEVCAVRKLACLQMLAHAAGEEALAGIVKQNS